MKLSDAIRLGSMMKPQGFFSGVDSSGGSCAFGAALEAIGRQVGSMVLGVTHVEDWHDLFHGRTLASLPCGCDPSSLTNFVFGAVIHLNDQHQWTREAIADWVQTIEDAQPALQPAEAAEVCR